MLGFVGLPNSLLSVLYALTRLLPCDQATVHETPAVIFSTACRCLPDAKYLGKVDVLQKRSFAVACSQQLQLSNRVT